MAKKRTEKDTLSAAQKAASRKAFIAQGGNDGRYRNRVIPNKKRKDNNDWKNNDH